MTDLTAWQLARMAGCTDPDRGDSPGAVFLLRVADAWAEARAQAPDDDIADRIHEVADGAVPIATWELWRTFLDLGAWDAGDEARDEYGPTFRNDHGNGMTAWAAVALYRIAEALCHALADEYEDEADETDDPRDLRELAADWHGGQGSALYAYASTGTVLPNLAREVRSNIADRERTAHDTYPLDAERDLADLRRLLTVAEPVEAEADRIAEREADDSDA